MKKLLFCALMATLTFISLGQVSKYPPKAVAIFLGEKHPEFNESDFPNIEFYYVVKERYKNPEGMLNGMNEGTNLLFGKDGIFIVPLKYAETESNLGEAFSFMKRNKVVTDGQEVDITPLDDYTITYIKKGKGIKPGKKLKHFHYQFNSDSVTAHVVKIRTHL